MIKRIIIILINLRSNIKRFEHKRLITFCFYISKKRKIGTVDKNRPTSNQ